MLNKLSDNYGARQRKKRVGRGIGSGLGKTAGKGHKGQKARSGVAINGFEGGQMPLYQRLPKRGFKSRNKVVYEVVNLENLHNAIEKKKLKASAPITKEALKEAGLIRDVAARVKLLAKGKLTHKVTLTVDKTSESAAAAIKELGGTLTVTS